MPGFKNATRGTTTQRGYGTPHQRARRAAKPTMRDGDPCCICGRPMYVNAIEHLKDGRTRSAIHYDHTDSRDGYLGFAHASCNRGKGASVGGRRATANRRRSSRRY